jgi:hypothetical protein
MSSRISRHVPERCWTLRARRGVRHVLPFPYLTYPQRAAGALVDDDAWDRGFDAGGFE